ncbi:ribose-phosphate pyrophosphokinase [Candidatus Legionella polyplacis]|uniref:Ribose-phosphate pyrophosphokinase n=1 Tax=Candidatus Legionella polyplacis TaxID=2005262 RepID=A0ABZ2GZ90_9GAMM|nr:ribose-phosphate pyrophosphokinase [Candidatus Legionella polyplacis]ATW01791.1 ribose-phosphate pyrophosphokinase [Candidatus Legionella polyplacis]
MSKMILFTGNSNLSLSIQISNYLNIPIGKALVKTFSDGEIMVEILETVRGKDVFILQSTCAPANNNLMELLIMADALRRSSAKRIIAVVPYFGYARQDRKVRSSRVPITAKIIADMMESVGICRVVTVDLHADQIQGFFYIPVDNVYSTNILLEDIKQQKLSNIMVISPDIGGVVRARATAKLLNDTELSIIDKRRNSINKSQVMHIIGDPINRNCIIVDDIIDTAGTICSAAKKLKQNGALSVRAYVTHAVLSGKSISNIEQSELDEIIVTNTIPLNNLAKNTKKIRIISLAKLLAKTIKKINTEENSNV